MPPVAASYYGLSGNNALVNGTANSWYLQDDWVIMPFQGVCPLGGKVGLNQYHYCLNYNRPNFWLSMDQTSAQTGLTTHFRQGAERLISSYNYILAGNFIIYFAFGFPIIYSLMVCCQQRFLDSAVVYITLFHMCMLVVLFCIFIVVSNYVIVNGMSNAGAWQATLFPTCTVVIRGITTNVGIFVYLAVSFGLFLIPAFYFLSSIIKNVWRDMSPSPLPTPALPSPAPPRLMEIPVAIRVDKADSYTSNPFAAPPSASSQQQAPPSVIRSTFNPFASDGRIR